MPARLGRLRACAAVRPSWRQPGGDRVSLSFSSWFCQQSCLSVSSLFFPLLYPSRLSQFPKSSESTLQLAGSPFSDPGTLIWCLFCSIRPRFTAFDAGYFWLLTVCAADRGLQEECPTEGDQFLVDQRRGGQPGSSVTLVLQTWSGSEKLTEKQRVSSRNPTMGASNVALSSVDKPSDFLRLHTNNQGSPATSASDSKPKKKICCACPDTKRLRDECIVEHGEAACTKWIDAHIRCLRAEGFNV